MEEPERDGPPDTRTKREKALEDKLGGRTIMLVLISLIAIGTSPPVALPAHSNADTPYWGLQGTPDHAASL